MQLSIKLQSTEKMNFNVDSANSLLSHVTVDFKSPKAGMQFLEKNDLEHFRTASMVYWTLWRSL